MTIQEKLLNLVHNEVIPDVEDYLDELFELVASKKSDDKTKEEIKYMQEMRKEFQDLIDDLEAGEIDDEEAQEIIDEIIDMKSLKE
jgi:DNA-binding transcriptional regulator YhcF (GntR family)